MDCIEDKYKALSRDMHLSEIEFSDSSDPRKCELCLKSKNKFHCARCVGNGDFYHSNKLLRQVPRTVVETPVYSDKLLRRTAVETSVFSDKFSELRLKLVRAQREAARARDRCFVRLEAKSAYKTGNVLSEINHRAEIARLLRAAIEQRKETIKILKMRKRILLPSSPPSPSIMSSPSHLGVIQYELKNTINELERLRRMRVRQLVRYIFPDCGKLPIPRKQNSNEEGYDCTKMLQTSHGNAEMCLAAQLIALISHYLDIRLPFPIDFTEYGMSGGSEEERHHRLCACAATILRSKGLPPPTLFANNVLTSLSDILVVMDGKKNGCCPGFCGTECMHCAAWDEWAVDWAGWTNWTDPVSEKVEVMTDHDDDWENVPEMGAMPAVLQGRQNTALATSIMSEAAASLASIWRGWTTK